MDADLGYSYEMNIPLFNWICCSQSTFDVHLIPASPWKPSAKKTMPDTISLKLHQILNSETFPRLDLEAFEEEAIAFTLKLELLWSYYMLSEGRERYLIFKSIIRIADKHSEIDALLDFEKITETEGFLCSQVEQAELYLELSRVTLTHNKQISYHYLLKYLEAVQDHDSVDLQKNAEKAIKIAISTKSILQFGNLLEMEAIKALGDTPAAQLLKVFQSGTIADYNALIKKNPKLLTEIGVSNEEATDKIRVLTLATLASKNVSKFLSYDAVAKQLDISVEKVEFWVIAGIRAKVLDAKLDQLSKQVFIRRATHRSFKVEQWKELSSNISEWKSNIQSCLEVIESR